MNSWRIDWSRKSLKFLDKNKIPESAIIDLLSKANAKLSGVETNIDIIKMSGKWEGFYRIRYGRMRITTSFNFIVQNVYIDTIEWRTTTSYK